MKKFRYRYKILEILYNICLSFLLGILALAGICLLFCVCSAILPILFIVFIGALVLVVIKLFTK